MPRVLPTRTKHVSASFSRGYWSERKQLHDLLREFVSPGSLAFDVGACRGHYTETLLQLGARVVAVEPNPVLAGEVRRHFPAVAVEELALGSAPGRARLRLGAHAGHSTLSEQWAATTPERWVGEINVEVATLDDLIAKHGEPAFAKIDVEGYEEHVLAGLTTRISALSFEYLCAAPELAERAVARLSAYEFALAQARQYHLTQWHDAREIVACLYAESAANPDGYGDVYARAPEARPPGSASSGTPTA